VEFDFHGPRPLDPQAGDVPDVRASGGPVAVRDRLGVLIAVRDQRGRVVLLVGPVVGPACSLSTGVPPMTTATKMTPIEFLESDLYSHPDFVVCDDPRLDSKTGNKAGDEATGLFLLPNLVRLIRRIGGVDAVPETEDSEGRWVLGDGYRRSVLTLSRLHGSLVAEGWHPRCPALTAIFDVPDDWSGSPWRLSVVMGDDLFPTSYDLERLAVEALDHHLGEILGEWGGRLYVGGEPFAP
jgi:hypothetical protein